MNRSGEKKSSSKIYWILGGAAALVLIGGFTIVVLAAGIFYFSSGSEKEIVEKPVETKKETSEKTNSTDAADDENLTINLPDNLPIAESGKMTDTKVVEYLKQRKNVGSFELVNAASQDTLNLPKKMFVLSEASAYASYKGSPGNEALILFMGVYDSASTAKADFDLSLGNVRKSGAKNIKTASKNGENAASFSNMGQQMFLSCQAKICMMITTKNQSSILEFIKATK